MTKSVQKQQQPVKEKNNKVNVLFKKEHKNARSSHQQLHEKGKIRLFGVRQSHQHVTQELVSNALDLMDTEVTVHY